MAQGAAVDPRDRARRGVVRLGGVTPQHPVPGVVVPSEGVAHPEEVVERGRGHPQAMAARQVAGQREYHPPAPHQQQIRGNDLLREEIAHAPSSRQPPRQALRRDLIAVIALDSLGDRHRAPRRVREFMDEAGDSPVRIVGVMEHPNVAALPVVLTGDARVHGRVQHMERAERHPPRRARAATGPRRPPEWASDDHAPPSPVPFATSSPGSFSRSSLPPTTLLSARAYPRMVFLCQQTVVGPRRIHAEDDRGRFGHPLVEQASVTPLSGRIPRRVTISAPLRRHGASCRPPTSPRGTCHAGLPDSNVSRRSASKSSASPWR